MQFGIKVANYPLIPEDFDRGTLPEALAKVHDKLFGLTISPERLHEIRPGIEPVEHILFTQPGMRYCQAQALIHSLLKDEQFSALSEYDKTQITGRILEEVRGRMMEDIVLLETMKAADKDHRVFKLQFEAGEFDMVIYDQKENSCEIFEIKHSSKQVPFQYRHLVDEDKCQRTERRFGPIHGRYILYRGEDAQMENGVQYWNVENYLKALPTLDIVQVQEIGMQSIEPTL